MSETTPSATSPSTSASAPFSGHIPKLSAARGILFGFVAVLLMVTFGGSIMIGGLALVAHRVGIKGLEQIADFIMTPPTNDKLFTILSKGLGISEDIIRTMTVTTTPMAAFATDLTVSQQSDAFTQEALIFNIDGTNDLCVKPLAWVTSQTCQVTCAAATITCSGASTDGVHIGPHGALPRRWDGTVCACVVSNVGGGIVGQSERAVR